MVGMFAAITANSAPVVFQSSERQTSLLELYTSEGCSSCPPAEAWLSNLKASPGLWSDFVPVAFHVDYWNYLGWRDRCSNERFSDRQREYAKVWGSENIYTPEFVLNGKEWSHGFWNKGVPAATELNAGLLKVSSEDDSHWRVAFTPEQNRKSVYEVHGALLVSGVSSGVKAGENAGRQLNHDFAAIAFTEVPLVSRSNVLESVFVLDAEQNKSNGRLALAVWITPNGNTEPLQATGGWLTNPEKK
jgi:hypothetical protein